MLMNCPQCGKTTPEGVNPCYKCEEKNELNHPKGVEEMPKAYTSEPLDLVNAVREEILSSNGGWVGKLLTQRFDNDEIRYVYFARITPEIADYWLSLRNKENYRKMQKTNRLRIGDAMVEDRFDDLLCDPLKFSKDADVSDGQHRLKGCVDSGKPFNVLIVHGVDHTIKDGKAVPKTLTDMLAYNGVANSGIIPGVLRAMWRFNIEGDYMRNRALDATDDLLLDMYHRNKERVDYFTSMTGGRCHCKLSGLISLAVMMDCVEPGYGDYLVNVMKGKRVPIDTDPLYLVVNRFITPKSKLFVVTVEVEMAFMTKAWNFHRKGKSVKKIYYTTSGPRAEGFPRFDGFIPLDGVKY